MAENNYIVYMHIFPNSKKYIGITCRKPYLRWRSGYGYKSQQHIWRAIQKYGWQNIEHKILFKNLTKEEACNKEIELIKHYNTTDDRYGYNRSTGGEKSPTGVVPSEETRRKLSEAGKGRVVSEETRKKISIANKGNKNGIGRKMSEEQKQKLRQTRLGKPRSEETRKKLKEKGKEFWNNLSEEKKQEIIKNNLTGPKIKHPVSEETREKLRKANLGKKQSKETIEKRKNSIKNSAYIRTNEKHRKPIKCIETGEIFESVKDAMQKYNLTTLVGHLKGRYKTCKGKHYEYYVEDRGDNQ